MSVISDMGPVRGIVLEERHAYGPMAKGKPLKAMRRPSGGEISSGGRPLLGTRRLCAPSTGVRQRRFGDFRRGV